MVKQASSLAQLPDSLNRGFPNIFNKYVYNLAFFVKPQEMNQRVAVASNDSDVKSDHNAQGSLRRGGAGKFLDQLLQKRSTGTFFQFQFETKLSAWQSAI